MELTVGSYGGSARILDEDVVLPGWELNFVLVVRSTIYLGHRCSRLAAAGIIVYD
jgi:hypothetical protein